MPSAATTLPVASRTGVSTHASGRAPRKGWAATRRESAANGRMNCVRPAKTCASCGAMILACASWPQFSGRVVATMRPSRSTALTAATFSLRRSGANSARHSDPTSPRQCAAGSPPRACRARLAVSVATCASRAQRSPSARRSAMNTSSDLVFASSSAGKPCARKSRSERSTPRYIHADPAATATHKPSTTRLCRLRLARKRVRRRGAKCDGARVTDAPGTVEDEESALFIRQILRGSRCSGDRSRSGRQTRQMRGQLRFEADRVPIKYCRRSARAETGGAFRGQLEGSAVTIAARVLWSTN